MLHLRAPTRRGRYRLVVSEHGHSTTATVIVGEEVIGLARIAAPIACVGLAVLFMARTRQNRIAGLGYAGVGTVLLVASLAPPSACELAGAIVGAARARPGARLAFRREPWLVAFLALATRPDPRPRSSATSCSCRSTSSRAGPRFNLLWELVEGDERSREFGRATKPLALYLLWIGFSMAWTDDIRAARSTCSPSTSRSRSSRSRSRGSRGAAHA